jgi:prolyl oligopeptidase
MAARFGRARWTIERGEAVPIGTTIGYVSADSAGDGYIEITTGFTVPTRYDYVRAGGRVATLYQQQPAFDASGDVVEAHRVKSADGTPIDYYLMRPKKIVHLGSVPTLVTGYGGFDVTLQPRYLGGGEEGLWLSHGGALAVACIRGGGDRGEAWHQAAMGVNRQRAFDDFLAVTADLEHGFTSPKHLGAFGSSNGGLLVATVGIERPDMYGAIASDVPLTDMLRYTDMGEGRIWTAEFGDPRDSAVRAALLRYSPYQNVREGVKYPPFMITTSTQDNRVGPGHARKLAARLEAVGAPVYFYEESEGGHGVSDPLERPELVSFEATFLIDELMPRSKANGE